MNIFSLAKKPVSKPSVSVVELPQSKFSYRALLSPDAIISAKNQLLAGKLSPMLRAYRTFLDEDDNAANAVDIRSEALKASSMSFDYKKLSQPQIDYFTSIMKRFGPLLADLLLELKLTGCLFRQIVYRFDAGIYFPVQFLSYPNSDLRLVNAIPTPFDGNNPIALSPLQSIALFHPKAVLHSAIKYNVFFSFALNNWAQFTETYGKPPRIAKYKPGTTEAEKNQLWAMLQNFGTDLAAMVSDNVVIDFADFTAKSVSADLYKDLGTFCDTHITRRILGNTLSTNAVGDGGSYAQAKVHNLVRQDILAGDCRDLSNFISDLFTLLNKINFDGSDISAQVKPASDVNLLERIQIDEKLYNSIGLEFPEDYWYNTYNLPHPESK